NQVAYALESVQYDDVKTHLDQANDTESSLSEARKPIEQALGVMREEYIKMIQQAIDNRWIDSADNIGKQSGAFCAHLDQVHPYILISWTDKMRGMFTLAHELGHAGHFYLADQEQRFFNMDPSTFFVEAPST